MLIQQIGPKYYVWDNLNAEEDWGHSILTPKNATKIFTTLEKAVAWANKNDTTEYGYRINNPYRPKDGYKEKFRGFGVKI